MTSHRAIALLMFLLACPVVATGQTMSFSEFSPDPHRIDPKTGTPLSNAGLADELRETIGKTFSSTYQPEHRRVYVAVHIIRWTDPVTPLREKDSDDEPEPVQRVESSRWYTYSNEPGWSADAFQKTNRVFGVSDLWVVAMHLNVYLKGTADKADRLKNYQADYKVNSVARVSQPIQNLTLLASLFPGLPAPGAAGGESPLKAENRLSLWSAKHAPVSNPSDITITPLLKVDDFGNKDVPLGPSVKYDNEGRTLYDFGVAVPIRKGSDLTAGEAGAGATPKVISKSNAYVTADLYFKPIDAKSTGLGRPPHVLFGVSITNNPLHNFFAGVGWGPAIANFFAAYKWTRLDAPAADGKKWNGQVIFGVELPVTKTLLSKLK